jgi:phosphatidylserine/phosphatidylglycerophosphate/cardiolipin synthase-like enzyme
MKKILCAVIILCACAVTAASQPGPVSVFFSLPGVKNPPRSPEDGLVRLIDSSRAEFFGAFYDISSERIAGRLIAARARGVDVRLVVEEDNSRGPVMEALRKAGVPIVTDSGPGLMHNKFAIVDGEVVWTGSYNATPNGAAANDNNALSIRSRELAALFLREFREMFEDRVFGNRREGRPFSGTAFRGGVRTGGAVMRAYFSPEDSIERIIISRLRRARREVRFMAFTFTSNRLGDEMVALGRRGVAVAGVLERHGALSAHSEYLKFRVEGIDARLDNRAGTMHHKVIIIDGRVVIMGSFNFTRGADRSNDENILVIESEALAAEYLAEFRRLYAASSP